VGLHHSARLLTKEAASLVVAARSLTTEYIAWRLREAPSSRPWVGATIVRSLAVKEPLRLWGFDSLPAHIASQCKARMQVW
jgi:hypothetical protein